MAQEKENFARIGVSSDVFDKVNEFCWKYCFLGETPKDEHRDAPNKEYIKTRLRENINDGRYDKYKKYFKGLEPEHGPGLSGP